MHLTETVEREVKLRKSVSDQIGQSIVEVSLRLSSRIVFSIGVALCVVIVKIVVHQSFTATQTLRQLATVGDAIAVGGFVFLLTFIELAIVCERRAQVLRNMNTVAELNHHVRNALQAIQYAAYSSSDQSQLKVINEAIDRIERIMREQFPVLDQMKKRQ